MRLGTKVLLLTLATTLGLPGVVLWLVTIRLTRHEQARARTEIQRALQTYDERLDTLHRRLVLIVRQIMTEPLRRSFLERLEADDDADREAAVNQFYSQFLGNDVPTELASDAPDFQVLMNSSGQVLVSRARVPRVESAAGSERIDWPYQAILSGHTSVRRYILVNDELFVIFGVPLYLALNEPPSHAFVAGYRVNDAWVDRRLHLAHTGSGAPLDASFIVDRTIVANGTSGSGDRDTSAPLRTALSGALDAPDGDLEFRANGERFVGLSSTFVPAAGRRGRFIVASSLDAALSDLRELQRMIALITAFVVLAALLICRQLAQLIARPVEELVHASERVSRGEFGVVVDSQRRDELGQLAASFRRMAAGLEQRDLIKDTFGKFVDPKIVEGFLADPAQLRLGGERRVQTILFSDLSNFTNLSERLTPEELVRLLNNYLGAAADVVSQQNGIVDKFIGDALVAFWGPPLTTNHAELACRAALQFRDLGNEVAQRAASLGCPPVRVRVGLGTGEVLVGNIGSRSKYNYTVIGDVANLASRLEGINKLYSTQILATRQTVAAAGPGFVTRYIDSVRVLGRREPVALCEILCDERSATDAIRAQCEAYASAMRAYEVRDWVAAHSAFEDAAGRFSDGAAEAMAGRCVVFMERPPGREWDGVWRLDFK